MRDFIKEMVLFLRIVDEDMKRADSAQIRFEESFNGMEIEEASKFYFETRNILRDMMEKVGLVYAFQHRVQNETDQDRLYQIFHELQTNFKDSKTVGIYNMASFFGERLHELEDARVACIRDDGILYYFPQSFADCRELIESLKIE